MKTTIYKDTQRTQHTAMWNQSQNDKRVNISASRLLIMTLRKKSSSRFQMEMTLSRKRHISLTLSLSVVRERVVCVYAEHVK
jgi:predicted ABC-type ATPase